MVDHPLRLPSPPNGAPSLRKAIGRRHAIALYVSSVLGSGILVLPGLAARIAGPGALLAWGLLAIASLPFALTFAGLSVRRPEAGGIYGFAKEAFGPAAALVTGWLFALWELVGAPAVALIAAAYLSFAFPIDRPESYVLGFGIIGVAFLLNYRGIVLSTRVQLGVIVAIVALLVTTIASAGFLLHAENFVPFLPYGALPVGTAAALIFWSFLGYENVSNVAEEFENPTRDFPPSVYLSVAVVGALYFFVAFVTIGTGAYREGGGVAPFAAILGYVFGPYGTAATALLAVFIVFAVVNAYTTGMARVTFATARDGGFPRQLGHLHPVTRSPDRALAVLFAGACAVMALYFFAGIDLTTALLVASGAAIVLYIIGCAAGVRLRVPVGFSASPTRWLPAVSLAISVIVLPFIGWPALVAVGTAAVAWLFARVLRSAGRTP
jgi:amino acid efflux transporter